MWNSIWHTFFFDPIYNGLIFFIDIFPKGDVGLAIIALVVVVKVILLPLSIKMARTQKVMRVLAPKLKELKEKHKDNKEEYAKAVMAVYREAKINPFASILLLFIQLPIMIALYLAVTKGGGIALPEVNVNLLYSFIPQPENVTMEFLGLLNIAERSIELAVVAGIAQYVAGYFTIPAPVIEQTDGKPSFQDDFMRTMHLQMRYVLPFIVAVGAYTISAAIAIYFIITSLVTMAQEFVIRKHR